jgi:hypothetical protein
MIIKPEIIMHYNFDDDKYYLYFNDQYIWDTKYWEYALKIFSIAQKQFKITDNLQDALSKTYEELNINYKNKEE